MATDASVDEVLPVERVRRGVEPEALAGALPGSCKLVEGGGLDAGEPLKDMCSGGDSGSKSGEEDLFWVLLVGDCDFSGADVDGGSESGVLVDLLGVLQMDDSNRRDDEEGELSGDGDCCCGG